MAITTGTLGPQVALPSPECRFCVSEAMKLTKPSDGFLEQGECEEACDEDECVEDCECGKCLCEAWCAEARGNDGDEAEGDDRDKGEGDHCLDDCCCVECNEDRMYATRWDSLYTDGLGPISGVHGLTVDYEMCSPKELRRMIQDRGLVDPYPPGTTMKYFYVRTLTKADRMPPIFRFLDLPAEMRNLVYVKLLTLPVDRCHKHRSCFPQILRSSRQVHEEAEELLYAENTIDCDFKLRSIVHGSTAHVQTFAMIGGKKQERCDCCWGYVQNLMEPIDTLLPSFLRRIHSLNFNIHVNSGVFPVLDLSEGNGMMRRSILQFVSALMDQHCLKHVRVTFEDDGPSKEWPGIAHILQPLRRLRNIGKVVLCGKLSAGTISEIVTDMEGDSPTFNTIKQLQLIMAEAEAYEDLHGSINPVVQLEEEWNSRRSTLKEELSHHLLQVQISLEAEMEIDNFANERTELDLQIRLAKIQWCLDRVHSGDAGNQLKVFEAARQTRLSYAAAGAQQSIDFQALQRAETPSPFIDEEDLM